MKKTIIFLFVFVLGFYSCQKNNVAPNDDPENGNGGTLLKKIKQGNNTLINFAYDANQHVIIKTVTDNNDQYETSYSYADGKISTETLKYKENTVAQYTYSYNNDGFLSRCTIIGASNVYWEFTYQNSKITEAIQYLDGGYSYKMTFYYNGDNITEAIKEAKFGGIWERESRFTFEYDNKKNPYVPMKFPFSEVVDENITFWCPNNTTRIKEYDNTGILLDDTQYTYTYNSENYPETVKINSSTGYSTTLDFIY